MKKFYKENRVFVILMGVALVCLAIILALVTSYILNSSSKDPYGNRLDGMKDIKIKEKEVSTMESKILEKAKVQDASIELHGKRVSFIIDLENDATVEEAQNIAVSCLELLKEDYLNFYELHFSMTKSKLEESTKLFPMLGSKKAGTATISWSNNIKD